MSENAVPVAGKILRVLIVEDDANAARLMEKQLREDGITLAATHVTCLADLPDQLVEPLPDVVLSDYMLPDGNALEVLATIRKHTPSVPVVVVTGAVGEDVAVRCLHAGASDYLLKTSLLRLGAAVEGAIERRRAELDRDRLFTAINQAHEIVVITDRHGIIQYVNPAFEHISGYTREEAIGRKPSIVKSGKHDAAFYAGLWRTISAGGVWRGNLTNRRKDGTTWEETATISPVRDAAGRTVNYVAVKRDVTDEAKLRHQLYHSQKMEAIGTLAGGIAHDFNNILTSVIGYAGLARADVALDSRAANNLEHVLKAARRASDLVKQILAFSRQTEQKARPIVVQPLLKETVKLLQSSLPSTIAIRCRADDACGPVMADPSQVHQVIMNLCVNAFNAMKDRGGVLDLRLEEIGVDEPVSASPNDLPVGRYLKLTVQDSGCGMEKGVIARIFEPYFTTRAEGEGTGLGLSTVHGILQSAGGAITVQSEIGNGTVFCVYLPVCIEPAAENKGESSGTPLPGDGEHVMFVDDEAMLTEFAEITLARLGYTVTVFSRAKTALQAFRAAPGSYDLIVTDQVMPGMTGMELAEAAISIRPDIPIILTTGFSQTITAEMCRKRGIREFVMKPFVVRDLSVAIRRALGEEVG